jgi:hypothetical protein
MAEPLSIATGVLALINTVGKTTIAVTEFTKTYREARGDLLGILQELSTLGQVLKWLKDDTSDEKESSIPISLATQILPIISDCERVLDKIREIVAKHSGPLGPARWAFDGKKDVSGLREALGAHRGALNVTLETITM